jgi:hypothetical protein
MPIRRVNIDGNDENEKPTLRREVLTEMLRAGWPDVDTWCEDIPYKDKDKAQKIHHDFLFSVSNSVVEGEIPLAGVISLGGLARKNMPKAMYLLGFAPEGGKETRLPNHWPVLDKEPERKYIDE